VSSMFRIAVLASVLSLRLFSQTGVRIVSPSGKTVVSPGQSIKVTVEVTLPEPPLFVGLITTFHATGVPERVSSPPYEFTLTIPKGTRPGQYGCTAVALRTSGQTREWGRGVPSQPIILIVERAEDPARLDGSQRSGSRGNSRGRLAARQLSVV
jgi:hypothetical protein